MLHVMDGGRASPIPTSGKGSRRGLYREPCIPDIPYRAISSIPGLPSIPYTATSPRLLFEKCVVFQQSFLCLQLYLNSFNLIEIFVVSSFSNCV